MHKIIFTGLSVVHNRHTNSATLYNNPIFTPSQAGLTHRYF